MPPKKDINHIKFTEEEGSHLQILVEQFGSNAWDNVAAAMGGQRTNLTPDLLPLSHCTNRWDSNEGKLHQWPGKNQQFQSQQSSGLQSHDGREMWMWLGRICLRKISKLEGYWKMVNLLIFDELCCGCISISGSSNNRWIHSLFQQGFFSPTNICEDPTETLTQHEKEREDAPLNNENLTDFRERRVSLHVFLQFVSMFESIAAQQRLLIWIRPCRWTFVVGQPVVCVSSST
jgi:hypothetical protein